MYWSILSVQLVGDGQRRTEMEEDREEEVAEEASEYAASRAPTFRAALVQDCATWGHIRTRTAAYTCRCTILAKLREL